MLNYRSTGGIVPDPVKPSVGGGKNVAGRDLSNGKNIIVREAARVFTICFPVFKCTGLPVEPVKPTPVGSDPQAPVAIFEEGGNSIFTHNIGWHCPVAE